MANVTHHRSLEQMNIRQYKEPVMSSILLRQDWTEWSGIIGIFRGTSAPARPAGPAAAASVRSFVCPPSVSQCQSTENSSKSTAPVLL